MEMTVLEKLKACYRVLNEYFDWATNWKKLAVHLLATVLVVRMIGWLAGDVYGMRALDIGSFLFVAWFAMICGIAAVSELKRAFNIS